MSVDFGRKAQVIAEDLAELKVELTLEDGRTETRTLPKAESNYIDLSGLPSGEASIKVSAMLASGEVVGYGYTMAMLMPGRRSYASLHILLDTPGKSTVMPYSPLTPLVDQNVLGSQLYGRVIGGEATGEQLSMGVFRREGVTPFYFYSYGSTQVTPAGAANFFNLSDGAYHLGYHSSYPTYSGYSGFEGTISVATAMPRRPQFAISEPVQVSATQTEVPEVEFDLSWDLSAATPAMNSVLESREVTFEFPAKTGLTDPKYAIEIYDSAVRESNSSLVPLQRYETSAHDPETMTTRVSFTLDETVHPGTRYYVLKYWEGSGSYGGANAFGRTALIPFIVPTDGQSTP